MITAIFLLVVLGALGTMMVTFFVAQQQSSALDVMGSRAYQAARTGIEWAAYNIAITPQGTPWAGCVSGPLFAAGSLAGTQSLFTVSWTCSSVAAVEGPSTIIVYDVSATAVYGGAPGNPDYVERMISVKFAR